MFYSSSGAEMEFQKESEKYTLYVEPGSMYVMSGDARYVWTRQMRSRKKDNGIQRDIRWSLTFRHVEETQ